MWDLEKWYSMNLFLGQEWRHRCGDWTWGHRGGEEGRTNWEVRTDVCTSPFVKIDS